MDSLSKERQRIGQRIRFLVGLSISLPLFGYGLLCIIRGYGFDAIQPYGAAPVLTIDPPEVYFGAKATVLGMEYIAWAIVVATLIVLSNSMGWYLQIIRVVLFIIATLVILVTTWLRYSSASMSIIWPAIFVSIKFLVIFYSARWVIERENVATRD